MILDIFGRKIDEVEKDGEIYPIMRKMRIVCGDLEIKGKKNIELFFKIASLIPSLNFKIIYSMH